VAREISRRSDLPDLAEARRTVADAGQQMLSLLRSGLDPTRRAIGHWTVGDLAAHLSHVFAFDALSASGASSLDDLELPAFIHDESVVPNVEEIRRVDDVGGMNQAVLDQDPERRLDVLSDRIEESLNDIGRILGSRPDDATITWLGGAQLPLVSLAGHVLYELHCHGHGLARATRRSWTIDPSHVRVVFDGFFGPFMRAAPGFTGEAPGIGACIDIRLRGQTRSYMVFDDTGVHVERDAGRPVDLHMSADPATFLLVMSGRLSRSRAALTGGVLAWGRHPLRAMRLLSAVGAP
jgi:hypothetical protein